MVMGKQLWVLFKKFKSIFESRGCCITFLISLLQQLGLRGDQACIAYLQQENVGLTSRHYCCLAWMCTSQIQVDKRVDLSAGKTIKENLKNTLKENKCIQDVKYSVNYYLN